ncbi:MAG: hypothetical protein RLZZ519_1134 [Bacteroidota bacterium]|jgi:glycosyltransferase involved in cell wall biosynthesis
MRIVGTNHGGYANERNITDLPFRQHRVVRCNNAFRAPNYLYFKATGKMHPTWPFLHWDGGIANYDLLHFFNGISLGKKPWMSTFETYLPRWAAYGAGRIEWGLEKLASAPCKRLIAISECTRSIQAQFLADYPQFSEAIMAKVSVLHPPQAALVNETALVAKAEARKKTGKLKLVFVGADFFRKGGLETLKMADHFLSIGMPLHLEIVSAMNFGDYASQTTAADLEAAMAIMGRHPNAIRLHKQLPNAQVLALLQQADIGLLPTWADTYGYSVLESMASGCPVVSTDIRALPEINNPTTGWVMSTEKDSWGNAQLATETQRKAFSKHLLDQLVATFEGILNDPQQLLPKSQAALANIRSNHDPVKAAAVLEEWYALSEK